MELDAAEFRVFAKALRAPALWAFAVIVGRLGLACAVEACRAREIPAELVESFGRARWTVEHLPGAAVVDDVLLGVRLFARRRRSKSLVLAAEAVGVDLARATSAMLTLENFAGEALQRRKRS